MTNSVEEVLHLDVCIQRERGSEFGERPLGHTFCLLGWKGVRRISQDKWEEEKYVFGRVDFGWTSEISEVPSTDELSICEPSRKDREQGPPWKKSKTMTNLFGQKQEVEAVAVPSSRTLDDESESFLSQVKRSLTDDEYTQFVGLIQDYASELMKEDEVFKSVVKLFSIKDRDELLERFKENLTKRRQQKVEKYREQERRMGNLKN